MFLSFHRASRQKDWWNPWYALIEPGALQSSEGLVPPVCFYESIHATTARHVAFLPNEESAGLEICTNKTLPSIHLTTLSVEGAFCIQTSNQSGCQSDRSPSLQYSD